MRVSALFRIFFVFLCVSALSVVASAAREPVRVLVLGDSLVAGYGLSEADAFPRQLQAALEAKGHDVEVINSGVSGDTSAGGLARLEWALAERPQLAIIVLGANDALRGLPPTRTRKNLDAIISRLKQQDVAVLLAGMRAPRNMGPDYYNKFDRIYPELAARHEIALYPFYLEGIATVPRYNQADGIHPNAAGVEAIVRRILPAVEQLLLRIESS